MRITSRLYYPAVVVTILFAAAAAGAADQTIVLKAARMFDGKSKALVQNGVVIVQGDKIVDVGSNLPAPAGAKLIDLGDVTLSPGFMDAHTHLTLESRLQPVLREDRLKPGLQPPPGTGNQSSGVCAHYGGSGFHHRTRRG